MRYEHWRDCGQERIGAGSRWRLERTSAPRGERLQSEVAHPIAQLHTQISPCCTDALDLPTFLNRKNSTGQNPVDMLVRSLNVATRVRIPLGLQTPPSARLETSERTVKSKRLLLGLTLIRNRDRPGDPSVARQRGHGPGLLRVARPIERPLWRLPSDRPLDRRARAGARRNTSRGRRLH